MEHYGSKCILCGFDAREAYGQKFEGMIHIHHIKPLNEIEREYIVDPIRDLIPVCPNCHMILHSKKDIKKYNDKIIEITEIKK
ncbi:MAG: HNH endonuclease [Cellulosilyticaceae bacterium]